MDPTITDVPETPPYPLFDTTHLRRRIQALPPERQAELAELWAANDLGGLEGMLTAEEYQRRERLVDACEAPDGAAAQDGRLQAFANALYALPEPHQTATREKLQVYAGIDDPDRWLITGVGRIAEAERVISEAADAMVTTYGEAALDHVASVADLPPADDTAEQVASAEYPGSKADAKTVMAWVGEDRNRAARAFAHEQDRSTPRKGVTAKLEAILGTEGVDKVKAAMAAAAPPPMDLSAGPSVDTYTPPPPPSTDTPPAPAPAAVSDDPVAGSPAVVDVGASTTVPAAAGAAGPAPSAGAEQLQGGAPVEPAPAAPTIAIGEGNAIGEVEDRVAGALRQIGKGFLELAEAIA